MFQPKSLWQVRRLYGEDIIVLITLAYHRLSTYANISRSTQVQEKIRRDGITAKEEANTTHYQVGQVVRRVIIKDLDGTPSEQLPTPQEGVKQVERKEQQWLQLREKNTAWESLFPDD